MRKLGLALVALLLGLAPAQPQVVSWPPPAGTTGILCVYNTSPPTLADTNVGFAQCDSTGALIVAASLTPPALQNVNLTQVGSAAVALGQAAMAASIPVVVASNQTAIPNTPNPSSAAAAAATSASSTAAGSNLVLKASAGNLYGLTITIGATSGYVMLFDATSLPSNGAVTPVWCRPVDSNGTNGALSASWATPKRFGTGITAGFSTTGCFNLTASATGNFFGEYQ